MASIKAILRKTNKPRKDGKWPLAIRVTKDRKSKFIWLKQYVGEKDWDIRNGTVKRSHPNSTRLNHLIAKKIAELNNLVLEIEDKEESTSIIDIRNALTKKKRKNITFFQLAQERLDDYKKRKVFTVYDTDEGRIKTFKKFLGGKDIYFHEITVPLLKKLKTYLIAVNGNSERTVANYYILIRTLFNQAIKEGIIERKYYPFGGEGISIKLGESSKIGLNEEELKILEGMQYALGSAKWHTLNVWLTSFYFAGIRISDVVKLRWSDIPDGRLYYRMDKNQKRVSLKIPEKAQRIFDLYLPGKKSEGDFIFPDLKKADLTDKEDVYTKVKTASRRFNRYLKKIAEDAGISKNLSNHISRHSFGNISGDKIPIPMLQKLYRHSDIKTTIGYQNNFLYQDADDALDAVVGF
jgi:integrase